MLANKSPTLPGVNALRTVVISKAAAAQRTGRAGRLGPGVCYRLWDQDDDEKMTAATPPEILEADLSPLMLSLSVW